MATWQKGTKNKVNYTQLHHASLDEFTRSGEQPWSTNFSLFVCLSVCLVFSVCVSLSLSLSPSRSLHICLSLFLSFSLSLPLSLCVCVCVCVCVIVRVRTYQNFDRNCPFTTSKHTNIKPSHLPLRTRYPAWHFETVHPDEYFLV